MARRTLIDFGHLAALSTFAFAQQLFDVLGKNAEFFGTRGSPRIDILAYSIGLTLFPPLALLAAELLAGLASSALRTGLHLAFVAGLVAVIALQVVRDGVTAGAAAIALALGLGAAGAVAYHRFEAVRSFVSVLSPAPLAFLALFLVLSPVSKLVLPQGSEARAAGISARAPVLWIVLDEVPITTFMDSRGGIDAGRYPNLAGLARGSTWYRNTASVHQETPYAVPAIFDGREPSARRLPIAADHPRSALQLFGGEYRMHVSEEATSICVPELCREDREGFADRMRSLSSDLGLVYLHVLLPKTMERNLPSVSEAWGDFGGGEVTARPRPARRAGARDRAQRKARLRGNLNQGRPGRFAKFIRDIDASGRPQFALKHTLLPHVPYQYVPSGREYRSEPSETIPGLNSRQGYGVGYLQEQGSQRHLLQAGDADRLLGVAVRRLKRLGIYDEALVAVVADHGVSFQAGRGRRDVYPGNVADIAPVPFFLKAPHQRRGSVSDKPLRTIDVLPTIADVLHVRIPWKIEGRSALRPTVAAQRRRTSLSRSWKAVPVDTPGYEAARRASLRRRIALLGQGSWGSVFRLGPNPELVGRRTSELSPATSSGPRARFNRGGDLRRVDPDSGFVPVHVTGRIDGGPTGGERPLALAVNGRVEAVGQSFSLQGSGDEDFSILVPERALRSGRNRVTLLWVRGPGRVEAIGGV